MTRYALTMAIAIAALAAGCSDSRIDRRTIPPTVEIITPEDDAVFRQGEGPVQVNGMVYDSAQTPETLEGRGQPTHICPHPPIHHVS